MPVFTNLITAQNTEEASAVTTSSYHVGYTDCGYPLPVVTLPESIFFSSYGVSSATDGTDIYVLTHDDTTPTLYRITQGGSVTNITLPSSAANFIGSNIVWFNGALHILGGNASDTSTSRQHYSYNGTDWTTLNSLPVDMNRSTAEVLNGRLYISPHTFGSNTSSAHYVAVYNTNDSWTQHGTFYPYLANMTNSAPMLFTDGFSLYYAYRSDGQSTTGYVLKCVNGVWKSWGVLPSDVSTDGYTRTNMIVPCKGGVRVLGGGYTSNNCITWDKTINPLENYPNAMFGGMIGEMMWGWYVSNSIIQLIFIKPGILLSCPINTQIYSNDVEGAGIDGGPYTIHHDHGIHFINTMGTYITAIFNGRVLLMVPDTTNNRVYALKGMNVNGVTASDDGLITLTNTIGRLVIRY